MGAPLDASCSDCAADICHVYPSCCTNNWDRDCARMAKAHCGQNCYDMCGNVMCELGEDVNNCAVDCTF